MARVLNALLKECREELNLRPEYVSNLTGMSLSDLNNIESGLIEPTSCQVRDLAHIYGYPEQYFYEKQDVTAGVLTRNGNIFSEFDKRQIAELLAFQREISPQSEL